MLEIRTVRMALGVALLGILWCSSTALAQANKPNIIFIMGDDIGWFNIGAYHQGHDGGPDAEPRQACRRGHAFSPTTTPRRAAPPGAPTSLPASCRSAPALTTVGQAGADDRHAGRGSDDRHAH